MGNFQTIVLRINTLQLGIKIYHCDQIVYFNLINAVMSPSSYISPRAQKLNVHMFKPAQEVNVHSVLFI